MNTESNKFKKSIRISHNHDAPTSGETPKETPAPDPATTTNGTGNSGKFDGTSVVNTAINGVTNILEAWLRKPDTYVTNNNTPKDNTGLYIGIGAGALVLIVLIFVLFKK